MLCNLHLKYEYGARSESRFASYSHCRVTWCPLTTGTVASQCPSAKDAALVTRYLTPLTSACLKTGKIIYHYKTYSQLMLLWHQRLLDFPRNGMEGMVTHICLRYTQDYLAPSICSLIKLAAMEKLMPFPAEIHTMMLCHDSGSQEWWGQHGLNVNFCYTFATGTSVYAEMRRNIGASFIDNDSARCLSVSVILNSLHYLQQYG